MAWGFESPSAHQLKLAMTYTQACNKARALSELHRATQHVNATIKINAPAQTWIPFNPTPDQEPTLDPNGYYVSDWKDGTTVATYYEGR